MKVGILSTLAAACYARKVNLRTVTPFRDSEVAVESRATRMVYDDVHYVMDIGVGRNDEHLYTLLVDSGSYLTFFGTNPKQPYIGSASQIRSTATWTQGFLSGEAFSGFWARDQTMIAPNLILGSTDFGVVKQIRTGSTTSGYTGVFALGPQAGLDGQMKSDTFSTWMTGATDAGIVPRNVVTIDLDEPSLTLGYVNLDNAVGELVYLPCLEAESWQVKIGMPQIGFDGSMIVDTGAPLFILTPTAMQMLMKYIPGSKLVEGTRILLVPADHLPKDLTFMFGNLEFVLPGKEQLLGAATRRDWHGFVFSIFQQIADMPAGVDAIMGSKILQHLIVVLDDDNQQIGFAARKRT